MSKLSDMLEECHSRVIDETKIKSLLADAFNTTDEEFSTNAISFIIDSIIVGQVSAYEKKSLFSAYGSNVIKTQRIRISKGIDNNSF